MIDYETLEQKQFELIQLQEDLKSLDANYSYIKYSISDNYLKQRMLENTDKRGKKLAKDIERAEKAIQTLKYKLGM